MLNETASSVEDRPLPRSSVPRLSPHDEAQDELRQMVMTVFAIDREIAPRQGIPPSDDPLRSLLTPRGDGKASSGSYERLMGAALADARVLGIYEGRLLLDSEEAYSKLDGLLTTHDALPLFRQVDDKQIIIVISGRVQVKPNRVWVNALLLVLTILSTMLVGFEIAIGEMAVEQGRPAELVLQDHGLTELWRGIPYAFAILLILGAHELGHYFAARRHRLAVTLPYFIPAPLISAMGTFGAFIQLRQPLRNRKTLMDVGAAGPLAGLLFAIPILIIGLATSRVDMINPGGILEGNSLLYALLKTITFGRFLPDGQLDVYVNPFAWAGWVGLLVTGLNLIPIGQLDGGHILYALVGERAKWLYIPILASMVVLVVATDMWFFWLVLLLLFGRIYATPLDMITRLDRRRQIIGVLGVIVFIVTFVPVPFTVTEAAPLPMLPRNSVFDLGLMLAVGLTLLWTRRRR
jgi:membrane-associated protease RseP (regulator of RpoE activity)